MSSKTTQIRAKIINAQTKKISAEIEILNLLIEAGNKKEAESLFTTVEHDINTLINQDWYGKLLADFRDIIRHI